MTRRGVVSLIGLGLLMYLVALLATLPAARALALADAPWEAAGVQGTIWSGSAQQADVGAPRPLTDLRWDTVAWRLLTGRLVADASFRIAGAEVDGRFSRNADGSLTAQNAVLRGPARSLMQLARAGALAVEGDILARIPEATIEQGIARTLRGRFQWRQAALVQPVRIGLGTVNGRIQPTGENVHELELEASGGDVEGDGVIRLFANGRYEIDLALKPTRDAPRHVPDTLSLLAHRNNDGEFVIRQSGQL